MGTASPPFFSSGARLVTAACPVQAPVRQPERAWNQTFHQGCAYFVIISGRMGKIKLKYRLQTCIL